MKLSAHRWRADGESQKSFCSQTKGQRRSQKSCEALAPLTDGGPMKRVRNRSSRRRRANGGVRNRMKLSAHRRRADRESQKLFCSWTESQQRSQKSCEALALLTDGGPIERVRNCSSRRRRAKGGVRNHVKLSTYRWRANGVRNCSACR